MRMETMGGIEVAKHIRQLDDEVPILIVTATVDYKYVPVYHETGPVFQAKVYKKHAAAGV